jgi:hypothetical protein
VPGWAPSGSGGYGRCVRDVLVCTKAPLLFATSWWPSTGRPGEVKRVGSDPVILPLVSDGGGWVEVATASDDAGGHCILRVDLPVRRSEPR